VKPCELPGAAHVRQDRRAFPPQRLHTTQKRFTTATHPPPARLIAALECECLGYLRSLNLACRAVKWLWWYHTSPTQHSTWSFHQRSLRHTVKHSPPPVVSRGSWRPMNATAESCRNKQSKNIHTSGLHEGRTLERARDCRGGAVQARGAEWYRVPPPYSGARHACCAGHMEKGSSGVHIENTRTHGGYDLTAREKKQKALAAGSGATKTPCVGRAPRTRRAPTHTCT
jgi:hypothetical protein